MILSRMLPAGNPPTNNPPCCVACILREARRRYRNLPACERPGPQPQNLAALFTQRELNILGHAGRWPLDPHDLARLTSRNLCQCQREEVVRS